MRNEGHEACESYKVCSQAATKRLAQHKHDLYETAGDSVQVALGLKLLPNSFVCGLGQAVNAWLKTAKLSSITVICRNPPSRNQTAMRHRTNTTAFSQNSIHNLIERPESQL